MIKRCIVRIPDNSIYVSVYRRFSGEKKREKRIVYIRENSRKYKRLKVTHRAAVCANILYY